MSDAEDLDGIPNSASAKQQVSLGTAALSPVFITYTGAGGARVRNGYGIWSTDHANEPGHRYYPTKSVRASDSVSFVHEQGGLFRLASKEEVESIDKIKVTEGAAS